PRRLLRVSPFDGPQVRGVLLPDLIVALREGEIRCKGEGEASFGCQSRTIVDSSAIACGPRTYRRDSRQVRCAGERRQRRPACWTSLAPQTVRDLQRQAPDLPRGSMTGADIELFLVDGVPGGITTAELVGWTGHVLRAPRGDLAELTKRPELARNRTYLLLT